MVVHVTENSPQKWNMVLNNVTNLQPDLGKGNVTIEIVTHIVRRETEGWYYLRP